ncbi:MAG: hypothetical protein AAF694_08425 [Bacteroidota bacterium]
MKHSKCIGLIIAICLLGFWGCQPTSSHDTYSYTLASQMLPDQNQFGAYWYQGKAELTSYELEQARYGEVHSGHAVLIFVTEDFSASKQVKLDFPQQAGSDAVKILKCNFTKKFLTGIYPYSLMSSTFSPIDVTQNPHALKVATSAQEWCGHTYLQINGGKNTYEIQGNSYFESEGDEQFSLDKTWLEDEIWNYIRISPEALPTGNFRMIPSTFFTRLRHVPLKEEKAKATLAAAAENDELMEYQITYPGLNRTLSVQFQKAFPHIIEGWAETSSGRGRELTTRATRKKTIQSAYWSQNGANDRDMRAKLDL